MILGIDASNIRDGGGVIHFLNLIDQMKPVRHGVHQVIVWGNTDLLNKLPNKPWLIRSYQTMLDKSLLFRLFWQKVKLPRLVNKSCDIMYFPGGTASTKIKPYITMNQNMLPFMPKERARYGLSLMNFRLRILEKLQRSSYQHARGMIYLSEYARRQFLSKPKKSIDIKEVVIPHGVSHQFSRKTIELDTEDKIFRLVYVSIIDVYKHHLEVIDAVEKLHQQGYKVQLDLIGPAYPKSIHKINERLNSAQEIINYHGKIPHDDLALFYENADIFIFASSCESFGQIITEAMSVSLPIACAYRSAMPEILQDAAVYFDPEDSDDIAYQIAHLIKHQKLRTALAKRAYEKSLSYTWKTCAKQTLDLLSDAVL